MAERKGVYNASAEKLGRPKGPSGGAVIAGWEMLEGGYWRNVETGAVQKGIRAEDGGYVNPSFYEGQEAAPQQRGEPAPSASPQQVQAVEGAVERIVASLAGAFGEYVREQIAGQGAAAPIELPRANLMNQRQSSGIAMPNVRPGRR